MQENNQLLDLLKSIDERLTKIEKQIEPKTSLEQIQLPDEFSILANTVDDYFNPVTSEGQENLEKVESIKQLLNTLSQKETIESLNSLIISAQKLAPLVEKTRDIENVICIMADATDELMLKATQSGINIDELSENLKQFSLEIIQLMESGALEKLLKSGILDHKSIEVVGTLGNSLAVSQASKHKVGPFKLFGALFNKDIQRSLGFGLSLATHFGRKLKSNKE